MQNNNSKPKNGLTIKEASAMIQGREISAAELSENCLGNIDKKDKDINAYLEIFDDIQSQAKKIDDKILNNEPVGKLAGIPFAIKDNILIKDKIASAGSKMLNNYVASYDAGVIKKLKDADAILIGRTNMDEFAMGSSTENSAFGPTKNPHDLTRVPGGSSGGSAAAVAMDGCLGALGTDTGGSIRQPAGFCGVVGLKPTYGAVSRHGAIAMASSLDQIGPLTKTVADAEIVFNVIKGKDKMDSTSVDAVSENAPKASLKIGVLKYDRGGVDDEVNTALDDSVEKLRVQGHEILEIDLPSLQYSLPCYYVIMPAEVSSNLARFDGIRYGFSKQGKELLEDYMETRAEGFGKEAKQRIMLGTSVLSSGYYDAYYGKAGKVRNLITKEFENAFERMDAIILPTSTTPAFKLGEKIQDPLQMYLTDIFTVSANLTGLPAISVPVAKTNTNLPIGIQLIAPRFREDILFHLGKQIENYG